MPNLFLRVLTFTLLINWFVWWWFVAPKNDHNRPQSFAEAVSKYINFAIVVLIFLQLFGLSLFSFTIPIIYLIGILLVFAGVCITVMGRVSLGKHWVPGYRAVESKELITKNIYAFIRHPIYIGILFVYVGAEMVVGSWLFVSFLFLIVPMYFQAKKEEKLLTNHFKKSYKQYMQKTKMFIPFLW